MVTRLLRAPLNRRSLALVAVACGLAAFGCRSEQPVSRDDAIRYYLDHRDYEQAILLLQEKLGGSPQDDRAKIVLASAYSGSVGINTIDCFEVLRPKLFDKPLSGGASVGLTASAELLADALPEGAAVDPNQAADSKRQRALRAVEHELLKFTSEASDALDLAFRLPQVAPAERDRLVLSLAILADIPESSSQYLTAQLYQGVLAMVQFMNYFRDAIPPKVQEEARTWYANFYCQVDLGIMLPNLSRSVDYLSAALNSLERANRQSSKPIFTNLLVAKNKLKALNRVYLQNQDLFEFTDWSQRASKASLCE